jgi:hypothetical protein
MSSLNIDACNIPNEIFQRLYDLRRHLIWAARRVTDDDFASECDRRVMSIYLSNYAEDLELLLVDLGLDLSNRYYGPVPYEQEEVGQMKPAKQGGAWGKE